MNDGIKIATTENERIFYHVPIEFVQKDNSVDLNNNLVISKLWHNLIQEINSNHYHIPIIAKSSVFPIGCPCKMDYTYGKQDYNDYIIGEIEEIIDPDTALITIRHYKYNDWSSYYINEMVNKITSKQLYLEKRMLCDVAGSTPEGIKLLDPKSLICCRLCYDNVDAYDISNNYKINFKFTEIINLPLNPLNANNVTITKDSWNKVVDDTNDSISAGCDIPILIRDTDHKLDITTVLSFYDKYMSDEKPNLYKIGSVVKILKDKGMVKVKLYGNNMLDDRIGSLPPLNICLTKLYSAKFVSSTFYNPDYIHTLDIKKIHGFIMTYNNGDVIDIGTMKKEE